LVAPLFSIKPSNRSTSNVVCPKC